MLEHTALCKTVASAWNFCKVLSET